MRPLTPKEKKLSILLIGVVVIFANVTGLPWINRQQKQLQTRITDLRNQSNGADVWLKEKALWTERKSWLDANQPKLAGSGDASSSFLEMLQQSAKQNKIKIVDQKLLEPENHPGYQAVAVRMTVNGDLESIIKWLNAIQQPKLFQAVTRFNLKIEGEAPNMRCELDMARWYSTSS